MVNTQKQRHEYQVAMLRDFEHCKLVHTFRAVNGAVLLHELMTSGYSHGPGCGCLNQGEIATSTVEGNAYSLSCYRPETEHD